MNRKSKVIGLLLATFAIGLSSISASRGESKAESTGSVWLVVVGGVNSRPPQGPTNISTIEMKNMEDCEAQGLKVKGNEDFRNGIFDDINYICIQGR